MMALDGKAIIKEEITDKDAFEATATTNNRRSKGGNACKDNCRTPDSPESARAVAPRSPMSPQIHHSSLAPPPRPNRNSSSSPVVNGATTTPPPPPPPAAHVEQARLLGKIRKFLGSLVQLAQDVHPEVSERVRGLVLSLGSGGISIEDFRIALQEAINLPLRPYVIPLLKSHVSMLQREIAALSRATNQTPLQYVTTNETAVMEFSHGPSEYQDIFIQLDAAASNPASNGNGLVFKRRSSDSIMEHHNGVQEWNEYMYPAAKRLHTHNAPPGGYVTSQPSSLFEYPASGGNSQSEIGFGGILDKSNHRDEREMRAAVESHRVSRMGGEEEWKNIHTMLNCISAMVDKTKRAITILQQRGVDPQPNSFAEASSAAVLEIRRQTEEKVAEFKRNAEEAVNQVKRQACIEIQRAVASAESRAAEVMAQERLRMEKFFVEMSRHPNERDLDNKSPSISAGQNACWNCGRKATETCSGCNLARYCGAFCQHKDWEHHHQICGSSRSDVTAKHPSQVIALSASIRGTLARSPPTPSQSSISSQSAQPPSSQSTSSSLVPNGVNSTGSSK